MLTELEIQERIKAYEYYLSDDLISIRDAERKFNFNRGILDRFIKTRRLLKKDGKNLTGKINSIKLRCKTYTKLTKDQLALLEGYVLSDGGIFKTSNKNTARLNIVNTQKSFCDYASKYLPFSCIVRLQRPASNNAVVVNRLCKTKNLYAYYSKADLLLEELHKKWYVNKVKILPEGFKLSSLQVLIWFIGDGYVTRCRNSLCLGLCVNNFTYKEIAKIRDLFLGLDIHFNIRSSNYNTSYTLTTYRKQSILNFYDYIGNCPEELKEFNYKWKTYN